MKKLILLILFPVLLFAQERVAVGIYQDAKLLVSGDDYYSPGTIDILLKFEMQGHQQKHGYMTVSPEFEYSEIEGCYKRYTASVGYTLNKILNNTEQNVAFGFGFLERYGKSFQCFSASATFGYKINNAINIELLAQLQERKDLEWLYNDYLWRFSGFVGVKVKL